MHYKQLSQVFNRPMTYTEQVNYVCTICSNIIVLQLNPNPSEIETVSYYSV